MVIILCDHEVFKVHIFVAVSLGESSHKIVIELPLLLVVKCSAGLTACKDSSNNTFIHRSWT